MSLGYTRYLNLLKASSDERVTNAQIDRLFGSNLDAIDSSIHALDERMQAYANAEYMPVHPVVLTGNETIAVLEEAASVNDIPAFLRQFPSGTFVRIVNFVITLTSFGDMLAFYHFLRSMRGVDAGGLGVTKAQMYGKIRLVGNETAIAVTGADLKVWKEDFPSITVIPQRIENKVYYMNYDGSQLLHTETVATETIYDNGTAAYPDASYSAVPAKTSSDPEYMYSFRGWATSSNSSFADADLTEIQEDLTVYAAYARVQDIAPTLTISAYATAAGTTATATVTSWGSYSKVTSFSALGANGNIITAYPGGGILSVSENNNVTTVTVTPDSAFFGGSDWTLNFSDDYGSCTRSIAFDLCNRPVVTVTKMSSGAGDSAILNVDWGSYPNLVSYTCTYSN